MSLCVSGRSIFVTFGLAPNSMSEPDQYKARDTRDYGFKDKNLFNLVFQLILQFVGSRMPTNWTNSDNVFLFFIA